ncbi:MAG: IS1595 family transposase [Chloroflexota bacterium]|nr:IS1595 family transposase [Chloroflexota bacterium]
MRHTSPGKSGRKGISLMQIAEMFSTEERAIRWFEEATWPTGEMACMKCGSTNVHRVKSRKPMPYRCRDCRSYYSLKTNTLMEQSKLPLRVWGWAIYLEMTNLKGVSSMKLHRDLGISQPAAWFLLHRIRAAFADMRMSFEGPIEVDEAYFGGKRSNMSNKKRRELKKQGLGRGPKGKQAVVAAKDRETNQVVARVIDRQDSETLQGFVDEHARPDAKLYTDDATAYKGTERPHETVRHSVSEYVRYLAGEVIHTNGIEAYWAMLKRGHKGVYHRLSPKHLQAYVDMFAARHNLRELDTLAQIQHVVASLIGRRLTYRNLTADNGLPARAV